MSIQIRHSCFVFSRSLVTVFFLTYSILSDVHCTHTHTTYRLRCRVRARRGTATAVVVSTPDVSIPVK